MKRLLPLTLLSAILVLASCSSIQVTYDYDKTVDFNEFSTYSYHGWAKNSDKILTPFDKERIESAFKEEFDKRGLTLVKEDGELIVGLFIVTEEKNEQVANTTTVGGYYGWGYGGYYGMGPAWGWGPAYGNTVTTVSNYKYTVGTLVCDVFDAKEKKLIWEGIGKGTVDDNLETRDKEIPKAVAAIMSKYPVQPVKK